MINTGDNQSIIPYVVIGVVALVIIIVGIIFAIKNKKTK